MFLEASSSLGLGGSEPEATTSKPPSHDCTTSARSTRPDRTVLSPAAPSMPSTSAIRGRRRSASITRTRDPVDARAAARLHTVVVLPSPASELVTVRTLHVL